MTTTTATGQPRRKRRLWLKIILALAVLLIIALVLTPTIASSIAPGLIASKANAKLTGQVKVSKVSLSWFGSQKIGPVTIFDESAKPIANVDVVASPGLLKLASGALSGSLDIGTITLKGSADIVRRKDGTTNLQAALAPRAGSSPPPATPSKPAPSAGSGSLPAGLNARAVIENFDVNVTDETQPESSAARHVWLTGLKGEAAIATGGPAVAKLDGAVGAGPAGSSGSGGASKGALKIDATINNLSDSKGNLTLDQAKFNIDIAIAGLPTALADALANQGGKLAQGLGDKIEAKITATGDMNNGNAELAITAPHASATGTLAMADKSISTSKPFEIKAEGSAVKALAPALNDALAKSGLTLDRMPDVAASVDNLKIRLPKDGKLDLRGSSVALTVKTTQASGTLQLPPAAEGQQPQTKPFALAPLEAKIQSADLAGPVKLTASTSATLGGQPAGSVTADLTAAGLLDANGAPIAGPPKNLQGQVAIKGIATAIAQPFAQASGLDLPNDIGPALDVTLTAASNLADSKPGALPATDLDIAIASAKLNGKGGFSLTDTAIKSRGGDFTLRLDPAGPALARFVKPDTGIRLDPTGSVLIVAKGLDIPLSAADRKPQLDKAAGRIELWTGNLRVAPTGAGTAGVAPIDIPELNVMTTLAAAKPPKVELFGKMKQNQDEFTMAGQFDLLGAFDLLAPATPASATKPAAPNTLPIRPVGRLDILKIPTTLARIAIPPAPPAAPAAPPQPGAAPVPASKPLDVASLVRDVVGPTVNLRVITTADAAKPDALAADIAIASERLETTVKAATSSTKVDISAFASKTTLSAETLDTLLSTFLPTLKDRPRLTGAATAQLTADPISIPLKPGFKPDLAAAGRANIKLLLPGQTLLQGLKIPGQNGQPDRDLGPMGVEDFQIAATTTVAALMGTTPEKAEATLSGKLLSGPQDRLLALSGGATTQLTGGKPTGPINATLKIEQGKTAGLDKILAQPGLLSGALGDSLGADINVILGAPAANGDRSINAEASLRAPRISMDQPLKVSVLPDRISVDQPTKINWQMDAAWANQFLFKPDPKTGKASLKMTQDAPVRLALTQVAISKGEGVGPLKPGIFRAALAADIPSAAMQLSDGQPVSLEGVHVNLNSDASHSGPTGDPIKFDLMVNSATVGTSPKAANLGVQGRVEQLAKANGEINADTAQLTADGNIPAMPTALVDALAKQDGLLVDALGPIIQATLSAEHFGQNSGTLAFNARSERAEAGLKGHVENKVFILEQPLKVTVVEVTPEMSARLVKALPAIGNIQKTKQDAPGVLNSPDLHIPLDGDLTHLNGNISFDPGEAGFASSSDFAKFLKIIAQKPDRKIGRRLQPINLAINSGVVNYDNWELPLGEFKIKTRGTVDLVNKKVDIITYIPAGALTGEVTKTFGGAVGQIPGVGQIISDATMMPFRTKGTFDKQKTEPDLELFAKEFVSQLRPDKVLEKGVDDILGDLLKKKKDKPK